MARGKGTANLAASLEVLAGAPLDARDVCPTVADLYVAANWPYKYIGMKTTVQATGDTYRLVNLDVTQQSSWVLDGGSGGSGGHTIEGDGTAVTDRDTLNFKDMSVSDDSQNEKTDVKPHRLTQSELADIISPLPFFDFSNPGAEAFIFSTNERVIGQWIDGKPLYQKTIDFGVLPNNSNKTVPHNINNLERIVYLDGIGYDPNNSKASYPIPKVHHESISYQIFMDTRNDGVFIATSRDYSSDKAYITLRYTKTTDQPVATGEKIVGQWIDGKPLYEKTMTATLSVDTDKEAKTTTIDISSLNIDSVVDQIVRLSGPSSVGNFDRFATDVWGADQSYLFEAFKQNANAYAITANRKTFDGVTAYVTLRYTKT